MEREGRKGAHRFQAISKLEKRGKRSEKQEGKKREEGERKKVSFPHYFLSICGKEEWGRARKRRGALEKKGKGRGEGGRGKALHFIPLLPARKGKRGSGERETRWEGGGKKEREGKGKSRSFRFHLPAFDRQEKRGA